MYFLLTFSYTTWVLFYVLCLVIVFVLLFGKQAGQVNENESTVVEPDGPTPLPVIGSLHLLRGYQVPFQAFTELGKIYGDVFKIKLGTVQCVVVNGLDNIREVLIVKGDHYDGRPNFQRYNLIFDGDKRNCK